jgi:AAA15 family ATPase/GTPase
LTDAGAATFDLNEESSGTRNLFFIAGPILDILEKGLVLVVDELDTSLHTLIVREIVRLFHDPKMNVAGSQLIFTTHDTALLDTFGLFRRDQIWFVEKDNDQSSTLYSLLEFSPRKGEALERNYLQGRYGGIPVFSHILGTS